MKVSPVFAGRRMFVGAVALMLVLVVGWLAYQPATSGTFLLDDFDNLGNLSRVKDRDSAVQFVLSGTGGPSGRPVAMASFVPQAKHWGNDAAPFIRTNIFIHLFNALLTYLFAKQLARELRLRPPDAEFLALSATAVWLLLPILASSSLMIVQRMTTLSALFVLGGLNLYLLARRRVGASPDSALLGMSAALIVATSLAFLSKENGVLLPVFVLVLEGTLLRQPTQVSASKWRSWTGVFLLAPTAAIVVFLLSQVSYAENMILRRDFTGPERLLTEVRVLWEYLFNAFVARPGQFSPFHEAYPAARTLFDPLTFLAAAGWLVLLAAALALRRRFPVAAFAVLWYLAGHLVESTTLPLELYFEHRNYMPLVGPVIALAIAGTRVTGDYRKYARGGLLAYALVNAMILYTVASTWGKPPQAASFWYLQQPDSVRAATTLASRQMETMGPGAALVTLQQYSAMFPQHGYIGIPALSIACSISPETDHSEQLDALKARLPTITFSFSTISMLDELLSIVGSGDCETVDIEDVEALAAALVENPAYGGSSRYLQLHYKLLARIARIRGQRDESLDYLVQAADYRRDDDLNMMMVTTLVERGRFDDARDYIEAARDALPAYPLRRLGANMHLGELSLYIDEAEKLARSRADEDPREPEESE